LSVTSKEYKEVPLSLSEAVLTPWSCIWSWVHDVWKSAQLWQQLEPIASWQWRRSRKRPSWL